VSLSVNPLRLVCGDADLVSSVSILSALNECDVAKASGPKSGLQCGGIERHVRVVDVSLPNPLSVKGIRCHETAAGLQDSVKFAKQLILLRFRRQVVEHREAGRGREPIVWQRQFGAIAPDHFDIGTGEADFQVGCKTGVDLNRRDGGDAQAQEVSGETWTRSDLQYVIAKLNGRFKPRQKVGLQAIGPFGAGEILEMGSVHDLLVPSTRMAVSAVPAIGHTCSTIDRSALWDPCNCSKTSSMPVREATASDPCAVKSAERQQADW
jgi:hypothetical protein